MRRQKTIDIIVRLGKLRKRGGYGVVVAQDPVEVPGRVQIPLATLTISGLKIALLKYNV